MKSVILMGGVFVLEEKGSMDKINVLGTEYSVEYKAEIDDVGLVGLKGTATAHQSALCLERPGERSPMDADKPEVRRRRFGAARIVHAFLFESGLSEFSHDETLCRVDSSATFKNAGCVKRNGMFGVTQ